MAAIDPALGKYLTVSVAYRGKLSMRDSASPSFARVSTYSVTVETAVYDFQNKVSYCGSVNKKAKGSYGLVLVELGILCSLGRTS